MRTTRMTRQAGRVAMRAASWSGGGDKDDENGKSEERQGRRWRRGAAVVFANLPFSRVLFFCCGLADGFFGEPVLKEGELPKRQRRSNFGPLHAAVSTAVANRFGEVAERSGVAMWQDGWACSALWLADPSCDARNLRQTPSRRAATTNGSLGTCLRKTVLDLHTTQDIPQGPRLRKGSNVVRCIHILGTLWARAVGDARQLEETRCHGSALCAP